jgi:hypothetical protein
MDFSAHPNPSLLEAFLADFSGHLIENIHRGRVVEYIVARAIPGARNMQPWHQFDVLLPDGTKVEVKQSAVAQTWREDKRSKPVFGIRPAKGEFNYDVPGVSKFVDSPGRRADVYVFAHNPLFHGEGVNHWDEEQWQFYVIPASKLKPSAKTISLSVLKQLKAIPCGRTGLVDAIAHAKNA